ncbi:glycosyltransferase [Rhizobium lusitanum]|nr:glycosyltransferase [Rhizobium lusitanum]
MKKIAAIIPFFQRKSGFLTAAVQSIIDQRLSDDARVHILIVNDESPIDPLSEISHLEFPDNVSFEIIAQENAGPAAARNNALDAVPVQTEFVAFLDSDDVWFEDHLRTAVTALGDEGVFYFSDNYEDRPVTTFEKTKYFSRAASAGDWEIVEPALNIFQFKPRLAFKAFIREYISQTSTVVYRFSKFKDLRFDSDLRYSGEDYFFWLSIANSGSPVTFSSNVNGDRDKGVSVYRDAYSWDSPKVLVRLLGNLLFWKRVGASFRLDDDDRRVLDEHINKTRMGISYLIMRNGRRDRAKSVGAIFSFLKMDPLGIAQSPALIMKAIGLARKGLLEF